MADPKVAVAAQTTDARKVIFDAMKADKVYADMIPDDENDFYLKMEDPEISEIVRGALEAEPRCAGRADAGYSGFPRGYNGVRKPDVVSARGVVRLCPASVS